MSIPSKCCDEIVRFDLHWLWGNYWLLPALAYYPWKRSESRNRRTWRPLALRNFTSTSRREPLTSKHSRRRCTTRYSLDSVLLTWKYWLRTTDSVPPTWYYPLRCTSSVNYRVVTTMTIGVSDSTSLVKFSVPQRQSGSVASRSNLSRIWDQWSRFGGFFTLIVLIIRWLNPV